MEIGIKTEDADGTKIEFLIFTDANCIDIVIGDKKYGLDWKGNLLEIFEKIKSLMEEEENEC